MEKRKLITVKEAMDILNVSRTTLYNWAKKGLLKPIKSKYNHYIRYYEDDILKLKNSDIYFMD